MRNSNSTPPRYGAEGPPGGPEAWNQNRGQPPSGTQRMLGAVAGMNPQMQAMLQQRQQQAMSQPRPWDQVGRVQWDQAGRVQWPGQGGGPPQSPPPMGGPPQSPPPVPTQQTGMAGLGQAMGKGAQMLRQANALRRGRMQEQ